MAAGRQRDMGAEIGRAIADTSLQRALQNAMATLYERRAHALSGDFDFEGLRSQARELKDEALARNAELLDMFEDRVTALGGTVVRAATAEEARGYIAGLARERGVRSVVKSKSMTSEEIHVNQALEREGVEVVETDLGERIIQLAGERPSHLVVPAIHKTKEQVIELVSRTMGVADPPTDAGGLTRLVREDLRERFLTADMGITGANLAVAETGTLVLVENEGNIRLSSQLPPIHVALVGQEKLIPRLEDVETFLELLPRSGTGQLLTSYVSFITASPATSVLDFGRESTVEAREFHVVVLDNGRSAALADPELREALRCIRCGACLNACAPYTVVGGHVYGADPYPGGIGCAWAYITKDHLEAKAINGLCTTCSRCTEVCPVKIDIPWLNTVIKERSNREFGVGWRERVFARADLLADVAGPIAPVANRIGRTSLAKASVGALGMDPSRDAPAYERETLERWFARRAAARGRAGSLNAPPATESGRRRKTPSAGVSLAGVSAAGTGRRKVALFVDCFVNHNLPQVGRAAVEVLERCRVEVVLAHNACCGRPAMSQGLLARPRTWAAANLEELGRLVDEGFDVVCIEPSCLSTLREDYRRLLETTSLADDPRIDLLEERSFDVTEYLVLLAREHALPLHLAVTDRPYVVHPHCHQKSLGIGNAPAEVLRLIPGITVNEVDQLCCGLVGSFGYKAEYSDLSWAIGGRLFERIAEHDGDVVACGISCRSQIEQGTGRRVVHPVEVLAEALR